MAPAFEISALPCGCYRREGDGRWFYLPNCPQHGTEPAPVQGHWEWPKPTPIGPPGDRFRSQIEYAPRFVPDPPRIYR